MTRITQAERASHVSSVSLYRRGYSSPCVLGVLRAFVVKAPEPRHDGGDRASERLEDLPPLRGTAVLDAEKRAAPAQHPARSAAERDLSGADRRLLLGAQGFDLRCDGPQRIRKEH